MIRVNYKNLKTSALEDKDLKQIINLVDFIWTKDQVIAAKENSYNYYYLLSDKNELIALINYQVISGEYDLELIVVDSKRRGQGIGRKLLENWLSEIGDGSDVYLEVNAKNGHAHNLYLSVGFSEVGCRKNYYQDGGDAIMMKYEKREKE